MEIRTVRFGSGTSVGNVSVTDLGFTGKVKPDIVFLFDNSGNVEDLVQADAGFFFGVMNRLGEQRCFSYSSDDNVATTAVGGALSDAACIRVTNPAGTVILEASFVSMDEDGFTISVTIAPAIAQTFIYAVAISGVNSRIGTFTVPTSPGLNTIATPDIQPNLIIGFNVGQGTTIPNNGQGTASGSVGFASAADAQGYSAFRLVHNRLVTLSNLAFRAQSKSNFFALIGNATPTLEIALSRFVPEGVEINVTTAPAANQLMLYCAMEVPIAKVGSFDQSTSTGAQDITGLGFSPMGGFIQGFGTVASSSINDHQELTVGSFDSTLSNNASSSAMSKNGSGGNSIAKRYKTKTNCIEMLDNGGTVRTQARVSATDFDKITLNNVTTDATSREFLYLAIGNKPGRGSGTLTTPGIF